MDLVRLVECFQLNSEIEEIRATMDRIHQRERCCLLSDYLAEEKAEDFSELNYLSDLFDSTLNEGSQQLTVR